MCVVCREEGGEEGDQAQDGLKKDDNFGEWYSEARLLSNFWVAGDGQAVVGFSRPYTAVNYRHNVFTIGGIRISELVVDARLLN